jgi:hypothetical protein
VGGGIFAVAFFVWSWIENTTVLAAVYGPKSVTGKKENPEYASLEVIWKPKSGLSGNAFSSYLQFFSDVFSFLLAIFLATVLEIPGCESLCI